MKFKGILLDIDNTIYNYKKTHETALGVVFEFLKSNYAIDKEALSISYEAARHQIHAELSETASSHNRILYFQRMFEVLKINALKHSLDAYNLYWDAFLDNLNIREGIYDFLERIKNKKICLVTDLTADIQHRKIQKMRLFEYADHIVTSEEAGREKPHPYIFMLAQRKLKLTASDVCMIGDDLKKDILGAVNLGIYSYWLNEDGNNANPNKMVTVFKSFQELIGYFND